MFDNFQSLQTKEFRNYFPISSDRSADVSAHKPQPAALAQSHALRSRRGAVGGFPVLRELPVKVPPVVASGVASTFVIPNSEFFWSSIGDRRVMQNPTTLLSLLKQVILP